jgi:hypothetical protein
MSQQLLTKCSFLLSFLPLFLQFGTTKPKLLKFSAVSAVDGGDDDYYDPYFECAIDNKGRTILRPREIPDKAPKELAAESEYIKKTCYWMDESFFGMHVSNFMNGMFGAREVAKIEEEYTKENMSKRTSDSTKDDVGSAVAIDPVTGKEPPNSSYKSRRVGVGFGPLIQFFPVIGNYIVLTINLWILYCMLEVGLGFRVRFTGKSFKIARTKTGMFLGSKDIGRMIFNIIVDFGIGLIPFVGSFVSIIHRSSSRNLAVFWKSMERYYTPDVSNSKIRAKGASPALKGHAQVL